jgi:glutamyl-tRNA synthetase
LVIPTLQERSKNLLELAAGARFFYQRPEAYDEKAVNKNFKEGTDALLDAFVGQAGALEEWTAEAIHGLIASVCEQFEVGMGKLAQPIRILISGGSVSPPIDATLTLLGQEESLARIQRGRAWLASRDA